MKTIIEMATEVYGECVWHKSALHHLEAFAALVRADEREECAKVCDVTKARIWEFHPYAVREAAHSVCANLAAAIRARTVGQA